MIQAQGVIITTILPLFYSNTIEGIQSYKQPQCHAAQRSPIATAEIELTKEV